MKKWFERSQFELFIFPSSMWCWSISNLLRMPAQLANVKQRHCDRKKCGTIFPVISNVLTIFSQFQFQSLIFQGIFDHFHEFEKSKKKTTFEINVVFLERKENPESKWKTKLIKIGHYYNERLYDLSSTTLWLFHIELKNILLQFAFHSFVSVKMWPSVFHFPYLIEICYCFLLLMSMSYMQNKFFAPVARNIRHFEWVSIFLVISFLIVC